MNSFRSQIFGTEPANPDDLLGKKAPRGAKGDAGLISVAVPRQETRSADTRDGDRQRLLDESVTAEHGGRSYEVELINLSGGGAMISAAFEPLLWDRVDLHLGENGTVECAVRWIKNGRIGLEFAHETRIDCSPEKRNGVLAQVIASNFPEVRAEPRTEAAEEEEHDEHRRASRHPLIWSGLIHFNYDSIPIRLRNISETGALIESRTPVPSGSELLLDLGNAGTIFAKVSWTRGDQVGLAFESAFDLELLAKARPEVAPAKWEQPAYLRDRGRDASPWQAQWGRQSLSELKAELEGFLKR